MAGENSRLERRRSHSDRRLPLRRARRLFFHSALEDGHIRVGRGEFEAVSILTTTVLPGSLFTYFLYEKKHANSLVHRVPAPITNRYRFKLGKGKIERLGKSPSKRDFQQMTFKPRHVGLGTS